jgi:formyltetrahydrofolate hydrolase
MVKIIQCNDRVGFVADIATVLAQAMQLIIEGRVVVYKNENVVFE